MEKAQSRDGVNIAFDRVGEGPAVILVDGALCTRLAGPMGPLSALLAPRFTVFTYDRRGRGDSDDRKPYAVEREVEDLEALIQVAGGSACVYGISSGAVLAMEAAARRLAITKLALYEPPFILDDSRPAAGDDFKAQITEMIAQGRPGDAVATFMTRGAEAPVEMVEAMRQQPMWVGMEQVAPSLVYDVTLMGDGQNGVPFSPVRLARLAALATPTLVMGGGESPTWLHHAVQATADAIPGARLRMLEGQTHGVAAEAIAPVLEAFFVA